MKSVLSIIFMFISLSVFCESQSDFLMLEKIHEQSKLLTVLESKVDSLSAIVGSLKHERNYFHTALSSQTAIFAAILTVVIFLVGLFTIIIIRLEIIKNKKRVDKLLKKQKTKFKVFTDNIDKIKEDIIWAFGNINSSIAISGVTKSLNKVFYFIAAAYQHNKSDSIAVTTKCLEAACTIIDTAIKNNEKLDSHLPYNDVKINLTDIISNYSDEKIQILSIDLFAKISQGVEQGTLIFEGKEGY